MMNEPARTYPTLWQKKVLWSALTALAIAFIGVLSAYLILGTGRVLGFLQPLLIPVAVAAILAYLLNPLVDRLVAHGVTRTRAVLYVFALFVFVVVLVGLLVVPQVYSQSVALGKDLPSLMEKGREMVAGVMQKYHTQYAEYTRNPYVQKLGQQGTNWLQQQVPGLPSKVWGFITGGVQGFMGAFGILLGLIVVPIYLYFFLLNAGPISRRWSDYLPLRASPFKDEVVGCLTEINAYLIAFFRGQILVTMIDGALLGVALAVMGLKGALLIGLMVAVLQLVPYLGVVVCWLPAMLIAAVQYHDWQHPLAVTIIFFVVTNIDGLLIAPRIVGGSVGLHPMTIIVSVFAWSLLVGGLLGALLAVPLTATLKVLLRRYVWEKQFRNQSLDKETVSENIVTP